jgi:hypothetical protein
MKQEQDTLQQTDEPTLEDSLRRLGQLLDDPADVLKATGADEFLADEEGVHLVKDGEIIGTIQDPKRGKRRLQDLSYEPSPADFKVPEACHRFMRGWSAERIGREFLLIVATDDVHPDLRKGQAIVCVKTRNPHAGIAGDYILAMGEDNLLVCSREGFTEGKDGAALAVITEILEPVTTEDERPEWIDRFVLPDPSEGKKLTLKDGTEYPMENIRGFEVDGKPHWLKGKEPFESPAHPQAANVEGVTPAPFVTRKPHTASPPRRKRTPKGGRS